MKKIIYITHARIPSEKTPSPFIVRTCASLVERGYEVELWVARRRNAKFASVDPFVYHNSKTRFPVRYLWVADWLHVFGAFGFFLLLITFNVSVWLKLRTTRDPLVYAHDFRDCALIALHRFSFVLEIHDFYESRFRSITRFVLKRAKALIVTNSLKFKKLADVYHIPREHMLIQPNAVDAELFATPRSKDAVRKELGLPLDQTIVLYAGHLYPWKGVYTLAEAALFLSDFAHVYFVGGTIADRENLRSFAEKKHISRVHFLPHQPHTRVPLYLRAADVVVIPNTARMSASKYETSPVKLFEYAASGTPLVASDIPSIRDLLSEREAFFSAPDDPNALARTITFALEHPREAKEKAEAARVFARFHSWENRAIAISRHIESLR